MKHVYSFFLFLGAVSGTCTQTSAEVLNKEVFVESTVVVGKSCDLQSRPKRDLRGAAIWENDFSEPSDWITFYGDNHNPASVEWEIITDTTAAPVGALNPIILPTAENGFAFINAHPAGEASVQDAYIYTANPIDLSGTEALALQFNYVTSNSSTAYSVVYSFDAGDSWNDVPISGLPADGESSSNPQVSLLNLTTQIADQPQVWIGFRFLATEGAFWAVDDPVLLPPPDNNLFLRNAYYDKWATIYNPDDPQSLLGADLDMVRHYEYADYGILELRPLSFTADVENVGSQPQTNVTFNVVLTDPEGIPHHFSESVPTLEPGDRSFIVIEDAMPEPFHLNDTWDPVPGTYTVSFSVEQDEDDFFPEDNVTDDKQFNVDYLFTSHAAGSSFDYPSDIDVSEFRAGSRFVFTEGSGIHFIQFALTTGDVDPTEALFEWFHFDVYTGSVYEGQEPPNDEFVSLYDFENNYFIADGQVFNSVPSPADETFWVTVNLPEPICVDPDLIYNVEIRIDTLTDGSESFIRPLISEASSESASYWISDVDGESSVQLMGNKSFLIRLGTQPPCVVIKVEDADSHAFILGQNYPNPVNGSETMIDWELFEPAQNITFTVHDINGRVVEQRKLGDRPAGKQETIRLNADLAAGVYQYSLIVGNHREARKMLITR